MTDDGVSDVVAVACLSGDSGVVREDAVKDLGRRPREYLSEEDEVPYIPPYTDVLRCRLLLEETSEKVRDDAEVTEDEDVTSDAVEDPVEVGSSASSVRVRWYWMDGSGLSSSRNGTE